MPIKAVVMPVPAQLTKSDRTILQIGTIKTLENPTNYWKNKYTHCPILF